MKKFKYTPIRRNAGGVYEKMLPIQSLIYQIGKEGFYDGLGHFTGVIPDFVIQGRRTRNPRDMSDPRVGTGGPGFLY